MARLRSILLFVAAGGVVLLDAVAAASPPQNALAVFPTSGNVLWYDQWGKDWYTDFLPIGNGYQGGMISGNPSLDEMVMNLEALWTGGPTNRSFEGYNGGNPTSPVQQSTLDNIRQTIWTNETTSAATLMTPSEDYGSFASTGSLFTNRGNVTDGNTTSGISNYAFWLDMDSGAVKASWNEGDSSINRTYICSYPDHVCLSHTSFSNPSNTSTSFYFSTLRDGSIANVTCSGDSSLLYRGRAEPPEGMIYEVQLKVVASGPDSDVSCASTSSSNSTITVSPGATEITAYWTGDTEYSLDNGDEAHSFSFSGADPHTAVQGWMEALGDSPDFKKILATHTVDYQKLYGTTPDDENGFALDLGQKPDFSQTTAERKNGYTKEKGDPYLEWLVFNYGRYLLIGSARGRLPANLQGVWALGMESAWGADYHIDVNLQMNYWGAETTNLGNITQSLWDYIQKTWEPYGSESARLIYNTSRGYIAHDAVNIFGATGMKSGSPEWALYSAGIVWEMMTVWDHYDFTSDTNWWKSQGWNLLKNSSAFWLDNLFLDEHSNDSTLVVNPCTSPENPLVGPTFGCSHHQQLIYETFNNVLKGYGDSGDSDESFQTEISSKLSDSSSNTTLDRGIHIGSWGQMQEWKLDLDSPTDTHRHISHLMSLYPGYAIASYNESSPTREEVLEAASTTLIHRGAGISDSDAGWEMIVRSVLWSQLQNATGAHYQYGLTIERGMSTNLFDLYDSSELFQIDANFGSVAAVINMLYQAPNTASFSNPLNITLLPALPSGWASGSISNARIRNGIGLFMAWDNSALTEATLTFDRAIRNRDVLVWSGGKQLAAFTGHPGDSKTLAG